MSSRKPIDAAQVRHLYQAEGLSLDQIAARLACSPSTVRRRLAELHVPFRPRGPAPRSPARARQAEWSPELAYALGVIATDGNLSKDGRHLTVSSKDKQLLEVVRTCLQLRASITRYANQLGPRYHRIQWSDRTFHAWLVSIGLMPAKSLQLGSLAVPPEYMPDFVRGCLDGDGCISVYRDRHNTFKNEKYVYSRLFVTLVSGSRPFLDWIQASLSQLADVRGRVHMRTARGGQSVYWVLKFAKKESVRLLRWIYYAPDLPCLERKQARAAPYLGGEAAAFLAP